MELKRPGGIRVYILLLACLLPSGIAFFPALADGEKQDPHKGRDEHHFRAEKENEGEDGGKERNREKSRGYNKGEGGHYSERDDDDKNGEKRNEKDKGDEVTGLIAAGLFCLANLSAIFSILSRYATRLPVGKEAFKNASLSFKRFQQKHLRRYHYLLNIAAIAIASLHWYLSKSAAVSLQQWGMGLSIFSVFSGIMIKYRLAPQLLHRGLFKFHTSLFMSLAAIALVVSGHVLIDD
jgi:hypothetical protein